VKLGCRTITMSRDLPRHLDMQRAVPNWFSLAWEGKEGGITLETDGPHNNSCEPSFPRSMLYTST